MKTTVLVALALLGARGATAQVFGTVYSFKGGTDGGAPNGLIFGKNGALYGTTGGGGSNGNGTVFELTPVNGAPWTKTIIFNFNGYDGSLPSPGVIPASGAKLTFGANGALYGTTADGGSGYGGGTVFQLAPPSTAGAGWSESVLYSLPGYPSGARGLFGGVLIGPGGTLYATGYATAVVAGGSRGGMVFEVTPPASQGGTWTENTLATFWPSTYLGQAPGSGVISVGGSLYGINTDFGEDCGEVFELSPPTTAGGSWTGTAITTFEGGGCGVLGPLTPGPGGVLYGTTYAGGSGACAFAYGPLNGCGTVFQLTPPATVGGTWTETVLYNFTGTNGDGMYPATGVVLGKDGVLYGTTNYGGSDTAGSPCINYGIDGTYGPVGCGTVFQLTPPASPGGELTETILHSFTGQNGEGSLPGPLTLSADGVLVGPTFSGGSAGAGTIFAVQP